MVETEYIVFVFIYVWSQFFFFFPAWSQIQIFLFKEQISFLFHYPLCTPLTGCVSSVQWDFLASSSLCPSCFANQPFSELSSFPGCFPFLLFWALHPPTQPSHQRPPTSLLLSIPPPSIPCCVRATPHSMAFHRKFNIGSFGVSMNSRRLLPLSAPWH